MIQRIDLPAREEFERRWVRPGRPVVMRWPRLSAESLKDQFGQRLVPVGHLRNRTLHTDAATGIPYRQMPLAAYLAAPGDGYAIFAVDELEAPPLFSDGGWSLRKLWVSGADTGSPLHQDLPENLYAQVAGRKQVTLFSPADTRHLYRHPLWSKLPNFSRVNAEAPDHARFPRFRRAQPLRIVLEPGDLLYIPHLWWHQMRALEASVSASYWWATGMVRWAVGAALIYKQLRALQY